MPTKNTVILMADDDPQILRLVARCLEKEKYTVFGVKDGQQAQEEIEVRDPDLVILNILMPKLNGFEVCEYLRTFSTIPIIVLSARDHLQDKVRAFEAGADDYITKPFNVAEFLARVRAVLRRSYGNIPEPDWKGPSTRAFGIFILDFAQNQVTIHDRSISLTPVEFRILAYLVQNAGRVITHDLLLEHVWGADSTGESHLISVNINRLRNKIEPDPLHPIYIVTKVGVGYTVPRSPDVPGVLEESREREA